MNVVFRPRLRARSSLYDLIAYRSFERRSAGAGSPISVEDFPPLPESTSASPISPLPQPVPKQNLQPEAQPGIMASKQAAKAGTDGDAEEHYGELD